MRKQNSNLNEKNRREYSFYFKYLCFHAVTWSLDACHKNLLKKFRKCHWNIFSFYISNLNKSLLKSCMNIFSNFPGYSRFRKHRGGVYSLTEPTVWYRISCLWGFQCFILICYVISGTFWGVNGNGAACCSIRGIVLVTWL